jgi:hypothetical protein
VAATVVPSQPAYANTAAARRRRHGAIVETFDRFAACGMEPLPTFSGPRLQRNLARAFGQLNSMDGVRSIQVCGGLSHCQLGLATFRSHPSTAHTEHFEDSSRT